MAGDEKTGVTIMRIVRELDAGPMFAAVSRPIGADETAADVERELATLGADLLVQVVDAIAGGRARETPQDERRVTYASRLTKEEGLIDWNQPAIAIHNKVRGLHPWPHAFTFLDGNRYIVLRTSADPAVAASSRAGTVLHAAGGELTVAAGSGVVHIREIQPEGRRAMDVRQFLAGHRVLEGAVFETPPTAP
jgi:methionyl-tRNA formyltransferase